jgi:DNA-binding transcriptional MerR regulator
VTTARAARRLLRRQGMPSEEIRAVLTAEDSRIVHRYLEPHRERMEERLAEERRELVSLEDALAARAT